MNELSKRSFTVASFDKAIELAVEGSDAFINALMASPFWQEFVPGFSFTTNLSATIRWTVRERPENDYNLKNRTIHATIDATVPVIVIIEAEFEKLRQTSGLFTLHGSAIGQDDMAIGFIGAISGLGKTTLCAYGIKHDWQWLSDEKFTIEASGLFVGGVNSVLNDAKTHAASAGLRPLRDSQKRPLRLLCIPLVTSEETATIHKLNQKQAEWQWYDETTRDIRQINGVLSGFATPLPSLDTIELSQKRQQLATRLANSVHIVHIRGSKPAILAAIKAILSLS